MKGFEIVRQRQKVGWYGRAVATIVDDYRLTHAACAEFRHDGVAGAVPRQAVDCRHDGDAQKGAAILGLNRGQVGADTTRCVRTVAGRKIFGHDFCPPLRNVDVGVCGYASRLSVGDPRGA